ncbi:MAG TPA: NAD(P)/FAD-dependent oxidoreductase [Solirubrobacterales bacterium]|jgi:2-polyprenyl-6-methoxyphenol hydroxylase-like FAD-dependent oxidoreductase|nr:NAD(P)/FAD-dependent oxidoreductase [Solirubrobacterales bacterium]
MEKDAIVVGARCAGSTLALELARAGLDVVVVDRDRFPSETISTHLIFPNTLARFEELGVLDTLRAAHAVPLLGFRLLALGHDIAGDFTPVGGFDRAAAPRRVALDGAIVDTALAAGVEGRFGEQVVDLVGSGTEDDPVRGVVLASGEELRAKWVFGADGRASTVAGKLGIEKTRPLAGEVSYLMAYWRGLGDDPYATSAIHRDEILSRWAGEDGTHLLCAWGDPGFTRGSKEERLERYLAHLERFPEIVAPEELEGAEMISDLIVAPESLMRGYFRRPSGPGWALVGDSCHFKHPGTAQGIGDAVAQAGYIAASLAGDDPQLEGYEAWSNARAAEHYEWSYAWGQFPSPLSEALFKGWASEADAAQDMRDSFSRLVDPSQVMSQERLGRWFG